MNRLRVDKRNQKLIELGFVPIDDDSKVKVFIDCSQTRFVIIDFSAVSEDYFAPYALQEAYKEGREDGKSEIRQSLQELLNP